MKLETWAGPNGTRHEQNLELQLKIQDAAELAQQNKKLLTAEWAAQVSDKEAQQSNHARAPTRGRHGDKLAPASSVSIVRQSPS
jgi:hypothetical protein